MKSIIYFLLSCLPIVFLHAQKATPIAVGNTDSARSVPTLKPYKEVVTPSVHTQKGLLTVHEGGGKLYVEIGDSLLQRDFLLVTRISRGSEITVLNEKTYPGDELNNVVVHFEKAPGNRLLLRKAIFTTYAGDSTAPMYQAVTRSTFLPILASFPILTYGDHSSVVDVTDLVLGDNELFSFTSRQKAFFELSSLSPDKSFIASAKSYPLNLEFTTIKTYNKDMRYQGMVPFTISGNVSLELNTSMILLPSLPMQQRFTDDRVGFFSLKKADYNQNPSGVANRSYIKRWRLEPKPEDWDKYGRGELVEPQRPIVFYIDPATPDKWIPFLIQGVNDWQKAFECAGFKNAIQARRAPSKQEDSTWSLYDARHSAIVYKPSETENAIGPTITDPRSGEILESHIKLYHNIIQLIHDMYTLQCSAVDPKARNIHFDDSLMGQLIRFVVCHEVGHTLGLKHNWGASSAYSPEQIRNKKWVEEHGFCPSIMDYARFNYMAQPEDSISEKGLFPRIGDYDRWAIQWGYRLFPQYKDPQEELPYLRSWVTTQTKDKNFWFGSEQTWNDPRIQTEDLSNNAIEASICGIKNLKRELPHLIQWTKALNENYQNLSRLYTRLQDQYVLYIGHVLNNIGGVYENMKNSDEIGPVYTPVSMNQQKQAEHFVNEQFFNTPFWLLDTAILSRTGQTATGVISNIQNEVLKTLFFPPFSGSQLSRNELNFKGKTYSYLQLLNDLKRDVWSELYSFQPIDVYRRNLQRLYLQYIIEDMRDIASVVHLSIIMTVPGVVDINPTEVASLIYGHLTDLKNQINKNLKVQKDPATRYHLEYVKNIIENAWPKK